MSPDAGRRPRGQGRQPPDPHGLPPEVQRAPADRRGRRAGARRGAPPPPVTRRGRSRPGRPRRHRRRGRARLAGHPARRAVRRDLAARLAAGPPVAEVAVLPDRASRSSWWRSSSSSRSSAASCPRTSERGRQRPWNTGRRRSRKAAMPSWRSSLPHARSHARVHVRVVPSADRHLEPVEGQLRAGQRQRRQGRDLVRPAEGRLEVAEPLHEPEPLGVLAAVGRRRRAASPGPARLRRAATAAGSSSGRPSGRGAPAGIPNRAPGGGHPQVARHRELGAGTRARRRRRPRCAGGDRRGGSPAPRAAGR